MGFNIFVWIDSLIDKVLYAMNNEDKKEKPDD